MSAVDEAGILATSLQVAAIIGAARELTIDEVSEWASHAAHVKSHHDAATAIIDPSAWTRDRAGVDAMATVARAFLTFRRVIEECSA